MIAQEYILSSKGENSWNYVGLVEVIAVGWSAEEPIWCVTQHPCAVILFKNILIAITFNWRKTLVKSLEDLVKFGSFSYMLAGFSDGLPSLCAFVAWQTFTLLQQHQAPEVAVGNPSPF